jgi:hypothetical protein
MSARRGRGGYLSGLATEEQAVSTTLNQLKRRGLVLHEGCTREGEVWRL